MLRQKTQVSLWTLYDFGNAMAAGVFGIYFSQWLVVDHHVSDIKFNVIFMISSLLLLVSAPIFGLIADKRRKKLGMLRLITVGSFVSLVLIALVAQFAAPSELVIDAVVILLIVGQYFYQLSYVFYNPLLKDLSDDENEQVKYSGYSQAASGLGQIFGLLATLPLATGAIYLIGHRDESQVFLPTAILFLLLTLPMLIYFREKDHPAVTGKINVWNEAKSIGARLKELGRYPGIHRFLFAYFLFNDAIQTAGHNFPIYVQQVFQIDNKTKAIMLGGIIVSGAIGAVSAGWLAQRVGQKKLLGGLLVAWVIAAPLAALQTDLGSFVVFTAVIGMLLGATATVARAVMTYLTPPQELVHAFSYYAMAERLASFLGPFSWGLITYTLASHGSVRYRIAFAAMAAFILIGWFVVRRIPSEAEVSYAND